jgi:hypothetical protein
MPIRINQFSGGGDGFYGSPFLGPVDHVYPIQVDLSALTDDEIDAYGYLKPGVPLTRLGALLAATEAVHGVTVEAMKVADDNEAGTIAALGTIDVPVATEGTINRDIAEDILGRAYTADEIAGFDLGGSKFTLTNT